MSYIKRVLEGSPNEEIYNFLIKEGFEEDRNPFGYGKCMRYVASNEYYTVWFCVHDDFIHLNAEYGCGGTLSEVTIFFDNDNFDGFLKKYQGAVDWTKNQLEY